LIFAEILSRLLFWLGTVAYTLKLVISTRYRGRQQ
jgi:hypothetical protein